MVKNLPAKQETQVPFLGQEDRLEKEMATPSSNSCLENSMDRGAWWVTGKNTGVGCHSLLQGIFLTQGLNLGLLLCRQILYCLSH